MDEGQRGFTLIETIVACAIVATLLVAGGAWMIGLHPGALAQATSDYDAALSSARALAMTSSNGATLVFAPILGRGGFSVRVYAGRPSGSNTVQPTNAMPVTSNAGISEKTLGAPPFAIFFGASGHVSGKASYPAIAANGNATFAPIATEPACPAGGFVLTFSARSGASATRTLACTSSVAGVSGLPNPSPTPNVPIVTPPALVYHWPADAQQTFVATEWGYTHWFATAGGFTCGGGVASFPNVLPSPYSPANTPGEEKAAPTPPPSTPYSYPNSPQSMNDAPAAFPLDPAGAGLCTATIADDYGQQAQTSVQVMGWLSATYAGKTYTHLTATEMSLPSSELPKAGSTVTIPLSKTYDSEALAPAVSLDAACSQYVKASSASGTTPGAPSSKAATASVTLLLVTMPGSPISCGGTLYDQYAGSLRGEGISFNAAIGSAEVDTWPRAVRYPMPGFAVGPCAIDQPRAYTNDTFATADANDTASFSNQGSSGPYGTDTNGCTVYNKGQAGEAPVDMTAAAGATPHPGRAVSVLVNEVGYSGNFSVSKVSGQQPCVSNTISWSWQGSSAAGPTANLMGASQEPQSPCYFALTDTTGAISKTNTTAAEVIEPCASGSECYAEAIGQWWKYDNSTNPIGCGNNNCISYYYADEVYKYNVSTGTWSAWQNRETPTYDASGKQNGCTTTAYQGGFTANAYAGSTGEDDYPTLSWTPTSMVTLGESALPVNATAGCQFLQGAGNAG
jgi:prepilin-type N-terminal cleavage/methylation domain-containing protein